jgi:hypothetical protein
LPIFCPLSRCFPRHTGLETAEGLAHGALLIRKTGRLWLELPPDQTRAKPECRRSNLRSPNFLPATSATQDLHARSTPQAPVNQRQKCHACVVSCPVCVTSASCQCHATCTPGPVQALVLSCSTTPPPQKLLCVSGCFCNLPALSLFLCLCITWTILSSFSCINSGPPTLPVSHLSLFWLWEQVSLHLYIVRDLLTSGSGHRSASS